MLDDKVKAKLDQSSALLAEMLPPLWWGIYKACVDEGFTESQALELVKTYLSSTVRVG